MGRRERDRAGGPHVKVAKSDTMSEVRKIGKYFEKSRRRIRRSFLRETPFQPMHVNFRLEYKTMNAAD